MNPTTSTESDLVALTVPTRQLRWRMAQLRGAGVTPHDVNVDGGSTRLVMTRAEYAQAQAIVHLQNKRRNRGSNALLYGFLAAAALVGVAVPALPFVGIGLLVLFGVACVVVLLRDMTGIARGVGDRHPDPATRRQARAFRAARWPVGITVLVLIVLMVGAAILAAMAMAGGLL